MMKALFRFYAAFLIAVYTFCFNSPVHAQKGSLTIGKALPILDQQVFDIDKNQEVDVGSVLGVQGSVFIFWSNQCAWTKRYLNRLESLAEYSDPDVRIVLVNSNNKQVFPREGLEESQKWERSHGEFAYLFDETASIAKAFGAERTPQVFAFDADRNLVYRGAIDDSPGDPSEVTVNYALETIQALRQGTAPATQETKSFGCQIRY